MHIDVITRAFVQIFGLIQNNVELDALFSYSRQSNGISIGVNTVSFMGSISLSAVSKISFTLRLSTRLSCWRRAAS